MRILRWLVRPLVHAVRDAWYEPTCKAPQITEAEFARLAATVAAVADFAPFRKPPQ